MCYWQLLIRKREHNLYPVGLKLDPRLIILESLVVKPPLTKRLILISFSPGFSFLRAVYSYKKLYPLAWAIHTYVHPAPFSRLYKSKRYNTFSYSHYSPNLHRKKLGKEEKGVS